MSRSRPPGPRILVIGQFPPPINGMAHVTRSVAERLRQGGSIEIADLSLGRFVHGPLRHALKATGVILAGLRVLVGWRHPDRRLYMPVDAGLGGWYTVFLAALARCAGYTVFLHHHSFAYLDRRHLRMAVLVLMAGPECRHILLCSSMIARFQSVYPKAVQALRVKNTAFTPPPVTVLPTPRAEGPLRLGLLANLNWDKGIDTLFALVRALRADGTPMRLVLAGPASSSAARMTIADAQAEFGEDMTWLGPVEGAAKEAFYRSIDVLVFPTRYRNEAQPLVVFEAMAEGVPVLAYARGCLREDIGDAALPCDVDFVAASLPVLVRWDADRSEMSRVARAALASAQAAHEEGLNDLEALVTMLREGGQSVSPTPTPREKRSEPDRQFISRRGSQSEKAGT